MAPREDFEWVYTDQPHFTRRKEILAKYPQIKKLIGHDPLLKYTIVALVATQTATLYYLMDKSIYVLVLFAYCLGGIITHSLALSIHEITHNLAFGPGRPMHNNWLAMIANLPMTVPFAMSFKKYHKDHHAYLANELLDPDVPTYVEAKLFGSRPGKFFWFLFMPLFYSFRPLVVNPKPLTKLEAINIAFQFTYNYLIYYFFGLRMLLYMLYCGMIATGLHPMSGHYVADHYMWKHGFETYSYYGPWNLFNFNVGYHNEHHDFPAIPASRLPELRKIAPEFYDTLPHHKSYLSVIYNFIMDPEIGHYSRIKRKNLGLKTD